MLRGVVQPREANSSRSGNIRSTGQKGRRWKKKQEQEQDVDDDDDDDDDQEISCGSGVPSSAHGAHTRRDGDCCFVAVGGRCGWDVWGAGAGAKEEEKKRRENTMRLNGDEICCQIYFFKLQTKFSLYAYLSTHNIVI